MNINRVMIVGTMVVALSFGKTTWNKPLASVSPVAKWSTASVADRDDLLDALNQSSDEELYDSLYDGKSLADIAAEQNRDINSVIELQVTQLSRQLDVRLAEGSITQQQHADHMAELRGIIAQSVLTSFG